MWVLGSVRAPIPSPWSKRVQNPSCAHRGLSGSSVWLSHAGPCWEAVVRQGDGTAVGVCWETGLALRVALTLVCLQGHSSGTSPMSSSVQSGTPITNDLFSQALQHALQASGQPSLQVSLPPSDVHTASLVFWMLSFSLPSGGPSHLACFGAGTAGAWQRDRRGCSQQGRLSLQLPLLHPVPMAWLH